jgi:uncharacterized repeat protein (TIGR03803 family)
MTKCVVRLTLCIAAIAGSTTLLWSCSTNAAPVPANSGDRARPFTQVNATSQYRVLYNFNGTDGRRPLGSLIALNGVLFGTTSEGGTHGSSSTKNGVVFSITIAGKERVVHDFGPMIHDGNYPMAGLLDVSGVLYGTTGIGNPENGGTAFRVTTDGKELVLYNFGDTGAGGYQPSTSLINVNGALYGTTTQGGKSSVGTLFSMTTDGQIKTLHEFGDPYKSDGQYPAGRLLNLNGTLYGTTYQGGIYWRGNHCGSAPCPGDGTVFKVDGNTVRVLHSFGNGSDGLDPTAGLIAVNGTLYGTTSEGGQNIDCGTVFSVTPAGSERVLHDFGVTSGDGCGPAAALIVVRGTLYGTTAYGGADNKGGTIFSIALTGADERVLHSFGAASDGKNPVAALYNLNGTLYGTTDIGGTRNDGTVFAFKP